MKEMQPEAIDQRNVVSLLQRLIVLAESNNANHPTPHTELFNLVTELINAVEPPEGYFFGSDQLLPWLVDVIRTQFCIDKIVLLHDFLDPIDRSGATHQFLMIVNLLVATTVCIQEHPATCELPMPVECTAATQSVPSRETASASERKAGPLAKFIEVFAYFIGELRLLFKAVYAKLLKLCGSYPTVQSPTRYTPNLWRGDASPLRVQPCYNIGGSHSPRTCI